MDPLMWHELRQHEVLGAILIKHKVIIIGIWWIQCDLSLRCVLLHLPLYGANDRELLVLAS